LSHLKERKEKNCLNCNAQVYGKYCHICGQENIEPVESVWHLVTHFFNDITHFDGKFFSTLKLLITKPGFLPTEYKKGRRASYLNPVRMYIFTSFIFFIIFFSAYDIGKSIKINNKGFDVAQIDKMDSAELSQVTKEINNGKPMTREEFMHFLDSANSNVTVTFMGNKYKNRAEYDSLVKTGVINHNWLEKKIVQRQIEINEKYKSDGGGAISNVVSIFLHMFPQILFVSLPLFAFILWILYFRRKDYYFASHGIYSVHLYIFYFISLFFLIIVQKIEDALHWNTLLGWVVFLLMIGLLVYEYKAMRNFYGQGRAKTIFKFFLAVFWRFAIFVLLAAMFLIFSIFKI